MNGVSMKKSNKENVSIKTENTSSKNQQVNDATLDLKPVDGVINAQYNDTLFKAMYRGIDNNEDTNGKISQLAKENFVELYNNFLINVIPDEARHSKNKISVEDVQSYNLIEKAFASNFYNDVAYGIISIEDVFRSIVVLEHQSTHNKNMCFRELIYYVKIVIKYILDHEIDLTKKTEQKLPEPEFYVIEFNTTKKSDLLYDVKIEIYQNYFLTVKVVYITIYCKAHDFLIADKSKHPFDSLLQCYAVFMLEAKKYKEEYKNEFLNGTLQGASDYEIPEVFIQELDASITTKIKNETKEDFIKLKRKLEKLMQENDLTSQKLRNCVTTAKNLGINIDSLSGYDAYVDFQMYLKKLDQTIKGNVLNRTLKDFRRFSEEDPTNVILQRFNVILRELGGIKMNGMISFIEDDDDDVKLSDLPFMKKKLAEQELAFQEKEHTFQEQKRAFQEKEHAFQEKELVLQKKIAEQDALIQQLLAQIK